MSYNANTANALDINRPDGSSEQLNIVDNAIREVKRAVKLDLDPRLTEVESDLSSAQGTLTTAVGNISTLNTKVTSLEGSVASIGSTVSSHTSTLSSHNGRITALENGIGSAESVYTGANILMEAGQLYNITQLTLASGTWFLIGNIYSTRWSSYSSSTWCRLAIGDTIIAITYGPNPNTHTAFGIVTLEAQAICYLQAQSYGSKAYVNSNFENVYGLTKMTAVKLA